MLVLRFDRPLSVEGCGGPSRRRQLAVTHLSSPLSSSLGVFFSSPLTLHSPLQPLRCDSTGLGHMHSRAGSAIRWVQTADGALQGRRSPAVHELREDPRADWCDLASPSRACHFDDIPSPSLLKHLLKGEGGCSRRIVSSGARSGPPYSNHRQKTLWAAVPVRVSGQG